MSDSLKSWFQALIVPIVLAYFGFRINNTLQEKQRAFDKIKFVDQILNEAFDSNNPDKAFALTHLIPQISEDEELIKNLVALINNYYFKKAEEAARLGNDSLFRQISEAAKAFKGSNVAIADSILSNPITSKAESASMLEQKGIIQIQQGDLSAAQQSFEKAEQIYPGFHSSYEISKLLKAKVEDVKRGADKNEVKQEVIDTIRNNYSWKLNMGSFRNVKKQ